MRKVLSLVLAIVMVLGLALPSFADENGNGMSEEFERLLELRVFRGKLLDGVEDPAPNDPFTSEQLMTILSRMLDEEALAEGYPNHSTFPDMEGRWSSRIVRWAQDRGLTVGKGDGTFGPLDPVNGQRLAAFMLRALGYRVDGVNADYVWANVYEGAVDLGIMAGMGKADNLTRDEVGQVVYATLATAMKGSDLTLGYATFGLEEFAGDVAGEEVWAHVKNIQIDWDRVIAANNGNTAPRGKDYFFYLIVELEPGQEIDEYANIGVKVDAAPGSLNEDLSFVYAAPLTPREDLGANFYETFISWTRQYQGTDTVTFYDVNDPGKERQADFESDRVVNRHKRTVADSMRVYWGADQIIRIVSQTTEDTLINGRKSIYHIEVRHPVNGQPIPNATVNVTFYENLDDYNDYTAKAGLNSTAVLTDDRGNISITPFQHRFVRTVHTRHENDKAFQVTTDYLGRATFTLTGQNTQATPLIFIDDTVTAHLIGQKYSNNAQDISGDGNARLRMETELFITTPTIQIRALQFAYEVEIVGGLEERAFGMDNARIYTVRAFTDQVDDEGNRVPYANGEVVVWLQELQDGRLDTTTFARFTNLARTMDLGNDPIVVTLGADGTGQFALWQPDRNDPNRPQDSDNMAAISSDNLKGTPVVWIDMDQAGATNRIWNVTEPHGIGGATIFQRPVGSGIGYTLGYLPTRATLWVSDGAPNGYRNIGTVGGVNDIYQDVVGALATLQNQSGRPSFEASYDVLNFTVTNTTGGPVTFVPWLYNRDLNSRVADPLNEPWDVTGTRINTTRERALDVIDVTFSQGGTMRYVGQDNAPPLTLNAGTSVTITGRTNLRQEVELRDVESGVVRYVQVEQNWANEAWIQFDAPNTANSLEIEFSASTAPSFRGTVTPDGILGNRVVQSFILTPDVGTTDRANINYVGPRTVTANILGGLYGIRPALPGEIVVGTVVAYTTSDRIFPNDPTIRPNLGEIIVRRDGLNDLVSVPYNGDVFYIGATSSAQFHEFHNFNLSDRPNFERRLSVNDRIQRTPLEDGRYNFRLDNIDNSNNVGQIRDQFLDYKLEWIRLDIGNLVEEDYTEESWEAFRAAFADAETVAELTAAHDLLVPAGPFPSAAIDHVSTPVGFNIRINSAHDFGADHDWADFTFVSAVYGDSTVSPSAVNSGGYLPFIFARTAVPGQRVTINYTHGGVNYVVYYTIPAQ